MRASRLLAFVLPLALVVGAAACGDDDTASSPGSTTAAPRIPGDLTVFAASSLTEVFADTEPTLEAQNAGLDLTFSFAGSGVLATGVREGAPVDVLVTADRVTLQDLVDDGIVLTPVLFARNRLQILVARGNPLGITVLADLADPDVRVVLGAESVPVGRYAVEALDEADVEVSPVSEELDVKRLVARVTSGEADAAIVYATDVAAAGNDGEGVGLAAGNDVVTEYLAAVVRSTDNMAGAEAYLEDLVSGVTQDALQGRGFLPPA